MSRRRSIVSLLFCACFVVAAPVASLAQQPSKEEALKDWNALNQTFQDFSKKIEDTVPSYKAVVLGDDYDKAVALLDDVEKSDLPRIQKQLDDFAKKYGKTQEEIDKKMTSLVPQRNERPGSGAGHSFAELTKWLKNIPEARKNKAAEVLARAKAVDARIKSFKAQVTAENYNELRSTLQTVLRFDPNNAEAKEWLARVDKDEKQAFADIRKEIDAREWPGHTKDFAGPGNPDDLAASCVDWFRKNSDPLKKDNPDHTVAVCIRGDWVSFKKNILGETIQWGLPICAGCYNDKEKAEDMARVFHLTMLTKEEKGVAKGPPWDGVAVGDQFKMHLSKIPVGPQGRRGTTGGFFGFWFWLALALANIVAGLLAAAPLLKVKAPQLGSIYDKITPLRNVLGVVVLVIGVVCFLRAVLLFRFAVLADILPQLSAMAAGLFLGKELLLKKPMSADEGKAESETAPEKPAEESAAAKASEAAEAAAAKAHEVLSRYSDKIEMLERHQVPIGIACIALGLLHLLIGGAILF